MLKKILNKNLLAALVIGGSLGLTNADMCMAATISCYGEKITDACNDMEIALGGNQVCQIPEEATSIQKQIDQLFAYCASVEKTTPTTFYIINGKALLEQGNTTKISWANIVKNLPKLSKNNVVCCGAVENSLKSNIVKAMIDSLKEQCHEHNTLLNVETYGGGANYFYCVRTLTTEEQTKKTNKTKEIETLKTSIAGFQTSLDNVKNEMKLLASSASVDNKDVALRREIKKVADELFLLKNTVNELLRKTATLENKPVVLNDEEENLNKEEELKRKLAEKAEKERLEKERLEKERLEKERLEKERLEKERLEKERLEKEEAEKKKKGTKVYSYDLD